jgi:hypothetical protein
MGALSQRLPLCPWLTTADLIFRGECRAIVHRCADLCEELVQRRFGGGTSGSSAFSAAAFARWAFAMGLAADPEIPPPGLTAETLGGAHSYNALLACVAIDLLGVAHEIIPFLPESIDLLWAPMAGAAVHRIFGVPVLSLAVAAEEFLPYLDPLPGASLAWLLYCSWPDAGKRATGKGIKGGTAMVRAATSRVAEPLDFFALDVATHVLHTYLLTAALVMPPSIAAFMVELATASLFVLGLALPDAVLNAVDDKIKTVDQLIHRLKLGRLSDW